MNSNNNLSEIKAYEVKLTVTDESTGMIFERTLPLEYYENDNGIRLRGEDMYARPSEIVLLSGTAVGKIRDLTGGGPDVSPCGEE